MALFLIAAVNVSYLKRAAASKIGPICLLGNTASDYFLTICVFLF